MIKKLVLTLVLCVISVRAYGADTAVDTSVLIGLSQTNSLFGPYWTDKDTGVIIAIDSNADIQYWRTTNAGATSPWTQVAIKAATITNVAVWFDKETPGDTGDTIHIAYLDSAGSNAYYRTLDISTNTLGTERTVSSTLTVDVAGNLNRLGLTKTVSGNIIYAFSTQTEIECLKTSDGFATSGTDISDVFETATQEDWALLYPAATADNNDACALFWDRANDEINIKMYDDSGNSWTETSISGSMSDQGVRILMDGAIRHSDSHLLMAAHSNDDSATDDLLTWDLTVDSIASPTVTAKTNIFTDQVESSQVSVIINQQNNDVYVGYFKGGTWLAAVDMVYQKSADGMGTWGGDVSYSENAPDDLRLSHGGRTIGSDGGRIQFSFVNDDLNDIFVNLTNDIEIPAAAPSAFIPQTIIY